MTPQLWQKAKRILEQALDLPVHDRRAYVADACGTDAVLMSEIESLLQSHDQAGEFLEAPALEHAPGDALAAGTRLGPYRIVQEIGEGGMGIVYQAIRDDDQFRKLVAIKIIKRGLDTRHILQRFHNERQILAHFDHPNIAKLMDGGTTPDGRPFFVMEFIGGLALDDYCDRHKLTIDQRLKLFLKVCAAVEYAHQNLVIHRDLKPSNILVTEDSEPKLLDFGIAKLLDDERNQTMTMRPMTPEYASPEQILGEPMGTASDIYSLGVLLYELLTGRRPYRLKSRTPMDAANLIVSVEPTRPSAAIGTVPLGAANEEETLTVDVGPARSSSLDRLRRQLAGDLDNIVLMALRKEANRRYASVDQLASDIRRYFEGRPVMARTDTLWYRTSKFVRRNRAALVSVVLVFASLVAGIITTAWQARVARSQRRLAEEHFQEVRQLANSLIFELHDAIQTLPGSTPARELLVKRALEYLDRLARGATSDLSVQRELAIAYRKISEVEGSPYAASLGHTDAAIESGRKGLAILDKLAANGANDMDLQRESAAAHANLGDLLWVEGKWDGALAEYRSSLNTFQKLSDANPNNRDLQREVSVSHISVGDTQKELGDVSAALQSYQKGLAIRKKLLEGAPKERRPRRDVAVGYIKLAGAQLSLGDQKGALESFRAALPIFETLAAEDPTNAQAASDLIFIQRDGIGDALARDSQDASALEWYRKALAGARKISAADPSNAYAGRSLMISHAKVGQALLATGQAAASIQSWEEALRVARGLTASDPNNSQARGDLAFCEIGLGESQMAQGKVEDAIRTYTRALDIWLAIASTDPRSTVARNGVAESRVKVGDAQMKAGRVTEALNNYQLAHSNRAKLEQEDPNNAEVQATVAATCGRIGAVHAALASKAQDRPAKAKEWSEAKAWQTRSVEAWQRIQSHTELSASNAKLLSEVKRDLAATESALNALTAH